MKWIGPTQFAIFRIIFGSYLTVHFLQLVPVGKEVFSNEGVIPDASILPTYDKLPLPIFNHDSPDDISMFLISLVVASVLFTVGKFRRISSLWLFFGWISLLNRNPLISNPSLSYIGWILLACVCIPTGDRLGFLLSKKEREDEWTHANRRWSVPDPLYYGMWIIMGVSYTASGLHKLQCQSWLNGTALYYVFTGPLARQNNIIIDMVLPHIALIKLMTWSSLVLEITFLFFGTLYRCRKTYWFITLALHINILLTINFGDLTLGMIVSHLYTFDPTWFEFTKGLVAKYDWNGNNYNEHDINHTCNFNKKKIKDVLRESITKVKNDPQNGINIVTYSVWIVVAAYLFANFGYSPIESFNKFSQMTLDMYWGFGIVIVILAIFMTLERIFPDQQLKRVEGWWKWVIIINIFQLFAVILATFTWENWLQNTSYFKSNSGFHLKDYVSPPVGGLIAYLLSQWLFYHWHKARHEVYILWFVFHQFHHSASRIETITSFYKHPFEIIADSQIMAILLYSVLGLTKESSVWLSIFAGTAEYFYHMNIKTPKFIGFFFQRPESHRCHHRRNKRLHCPNYSDLPLWDILGGTFENPKEMNDPTGFSYYAEVKRFDMMLMKDVLFKCHQTMFKDFKKFKSGIMKGITYMLVIWGAFNSSAFIAHYDGVKEVGFVTVSSPLPLVFSAYNGVETFATSFDISIEYANSTIVNAQLDSNKYNLLGGAYNRRNIYGAVFSHGPFFDTKKLITIRQGILKYAVCDPGSIVHEFGLSGKIKSFTADVLYRPNILTCNTSELQPDQCVSKNNTKIGRLYIEC